MQVPLIPTIVLIVPGAHPPATIARSVCMCIHAHATWSYRMRIHIASIRDTNFLVWPFEAPRALRPVRKCPHQAHAATGWCLQHARISCGRCSRHGDTCGHYTHNGM